ncbi:hypothetical protein BAMBUS_02250 [Brevundimonas phage vB_BpoS-Bambus]|nr:hypothetical protein BAMBUS_02250 [Brevundimonas phage vB_BpoS-Bambus]
MTFQTLISDQDASVNHILKTEDGGAFECRFVRRVDDYFIVYLSSHSGCDRACRMCHLTQTGQTMMTPATLADYYAQADQVIRHWFKSPDWVNRPNRINFNFMARGEPLANPHLFDGGLAKLERDIWRRQVFKLGVADAVFNLSTIMPASLPDRPLADLIGRSRRSVNLYYSLYSMRPQFRRRWLPKAMDPERALDRLAEFQQSAMSYDTPGEIVLHHSFIAGQNDEDETVEEIIAAVKARGMKTRFNCVRYNPYSPTQGSEPDEETLTRLTAKLATAFDAPQSRIVPRVGFDVKASCGMFLAPDALGALS